MSLWLSMALWSLDSGLYESPRLDRFADVYYLCHKVNKGYKGGIWRLLNLNHHLVQFFPHSMVGKRGVCWHEYRDTHLLLQVDTSHCMQSHLQSSQFAYIKHSTFSTPTEPSEMWTALQSLSSSTASWWPIGHLAWSPRYLPGLGPW